MTAICGCRSVGTHESILKEQISGLDKLGNVMVITREDGSGTRSTFSQLIDFDEKNKETGASDLTRTDAETADSASLVLETVAQEKNAIGYVSMGALDDVQGVKVLQIDGKTLNAPKRPLEQDLVTLYKFITLSIQILLIARCRCHLVKI